MSLRITAPGFTALVALTLAGCATAHHGTGNAVPRISTTTPKSTSSAKTTTETQTPVPTSIDAHGKATTECVTIPANWPMCAAVNGDGSVATLTTIDSRTLVNCLDATADTTPQLPHGEYNIACRVFKDRVATTQNPGDLPGHPLLCALVNEGTLVAGKTTSPTLLDAPIVCINTAQSTISLYRRNVTPLPCRQSGALADCRPTS
jgi:hypothetical protein